MIGTSSIDVPSRLYLSLFGGVENGSITAGPGSDTFNIPAPYGTALVLQGGGGGNVLRGPDADTLYALSGPNAGRLSGSALSAPVSFAGIGSLVGGLGADRFRFTDARAKLSGSIDGGGGTNLLDYSGYTSDVTVNLGLRTATAVGSVNRIQDVVGGLVNNLLVGDAGNNVLEAPAGQAGRNVLIGGGGADVLFGGTGEDLLIGGRTAYDADAAKLDTIRSVWIGGAAFQSRIDLLTNGSLGGIRLNAATVRGDGAQDQLTGGKGRDWLFRAGGTSLYDSDPTQDRVTMYV
jgi:Ca2+-binding RTX toxin-like protein